MDTEQKETKKGTKGKTSKKTATEQESKVVEKVTEQVTEQNNDSNVQSEHEDHDISENEEKVSNNSDTSVLLNKEQFLQDLTEANGILARLCKYNLKKIAFTKEELKTCDSVYHKFGTNKEKLNQKMLHINRDQKTIKKAAVVNEDGSEVVKDTSNHAVNKKKETFKEVLDFLDLPEDSLVSRTDVHRGMLKFIEVEKEKVNTDIFYDETKKNFKIIGKMKVLFDFIRLEKIKRGKMTETELFPLYIQNKDIMKYTSYCFPVTVK